MGFGCLKKPELRGALYRDSARFLPILLLGSVVPALLWKFLYADPKLKRQEDYLRDHAHDGVAAEQFEKGYVLADGRSGNPFTSP